MVPIRNEEEKGTCSFFFFYANGHPMFENRRDVEFFSTQCASQRNDTSSIPETRSPTRITPANATRIEPPILT